jgi:hypothetical protein
MYVTNDHGLAAAAGHHEDVVRELRDRAEILDALYASASARICRTGSCSRRPSLC